MAEPRLRVLALSPETLGGEIVTPFILVFDRVRESGLDGWAPHFVDSLQRETHARTVLVFADSVDLPDRIQPTAEESQRILSALRASADIAT